MECDGTITRMELRPCKSMDSSRPRLEYCTQYSSKAPWLVGCFASLVSARQIYSVLPPTGDPLPQSPAPPLHVKIQDVDGDLNAEAEALLSFRSRKSEDPNFSRPISSPFLWGWTLRMNHSDGPAWHVRCKCPAASAARKKKERERAPRAAPLRVTS